MPDAERPRGAVARLRQAVARARAALHRALYEVDESALPRAHRAMLTVARLVFVTVDSFFRERLHVHAAALAFFTVLSVVPFAALAFSVAKELGAYDLLISETVRPFLDQTFEVTGGAQVPEGVQVMRGTLDRILEIVSATDVRGLGVAGLVVLVVTVQRVVVGAEDAFDAIWGFRGRRRLLTRIPGLVLVTLITPAALLAASTVTAARHGEIVMDTIARWVPSAWLVHTLGTLVPPALVCLGILLLYLLLPSAKVRTRSAVIGAIVGGLGWYLLQVLHVRFQLGVARANALYSGFGAFPIFLLWLHLSWVMVLLGAQVASAHQNAPTLRQLARRRLEDHESREAVAIRATVALAAVAEPVRLRTLARTVGIAVEPLREVLDALSDHGLLNRRHGPYDPEYAVATDPDALRVAQVLDAVRRDPSEAQAPWRKETAVTEVLEGLKSAAAASAHNRTIGELRRAEDAR